uniref:Ciliary neurotrophic factor n=1 Tax=Neogobius melanostomus TaxID=47308 RepID=A0A8C6U2B6_9GOBI
MTLWWQALLLCITLSCIQSVPTAVLHSKYLKSYNLTRHARRQVRQLLIKYVKELGSENGDRSQHLKGLPSPSIDFYNWLQLTDRERLATAFSDLQTFRSMLEWKREELNSTNSQMFLRIETDLRDLVLQVNSFLRKHYYTHLLKKYRNTTRLVEGYIILRDLDLYLIKLARDFRLLLTKTAKSNQNL